MQLSEFPGGTCSGTRQEFRNVRIVITEGVSGKALAAGFSHDTGG